MPLSNTEAKKEAARTRVLTIHTNFNIYRNVNEAHEGPVTPEEERKALIRFVRWHERMVTIGKEMLARLPE